VDYHLERKIKLSEEPEFKNLYSWSLQELNEEGEKVGSDQVPWEWSLYFTASEVRYNNTIDIEKSDEPSEEENTAQTHESESITAILHPGICRDGKYLEDDTSYSMFGTNRRIKQFGLRIQENKEGGDREGCHIWGCVSYTTEVDFRDETTDDTVEIYLSLSPTQFNTIAELIKTRRADILQVRLGRVSGFYSEWSPSISTNNIKILAASKDQEVIARDGCEIEPPRLGDVGEFNLMVTQRHKLNPKQDLRSINIDKLFEDPNDYEEDVNEEQEYQEFQPDKDSLILAQLEDPDDYEEDVNEEQEYQELQPDKDSLILAQLARNEVTLAKLRTPIWLIFFVLCFLLAKLVF